MAILSYLYPGINSPPFPSNSFSPLLLSHQYYVPNVIIILYTITGMETWKENWKDWVELRRVAGRNTDPQYTYSEEQIEYHYTKNKQVLQKLVSL